MPSPLAHLAVGFLVSRRLGGLFFAALLFSVLPDMDFVVGFLFGDLARWHNHFSHSLVMAVVAGTVTGAVIARRQGRQAGRQWGLLCLCLYLLHLAMDYVMLGRGVMLAWPFTMTRYAFAWPIFLGVQWDDGLFSRIHLWTILNELAVICLLLLGGVLIRTLRENRPS